MKEILESIDNWTLIKLVGGISLLLSSAISFIAYLIKDFLNRKWKTKYEKEIVKLNSQLTQNNQLINHMTSSISDIYLSSNTKRLDYLDTVWKSMMKLKNNIPTIVFTAYTILTKEEIENLPNTDNPYAMASIRSFKPNEYLDFHNKLFSEIELTRPFIGDKLWLIFYSYQAFIGRLTYLIKDGLEKGKVRYWRDEEDLIGQILSSTISDKEFEELTNKEIFAFRNILSFLEYKALNDISEQITGKRMTTETISQAIKFSKIQAKMQ